MTISLPGGTVTFFLTDIERSTALWEAHGEAMGRAVERHEAIVGEAVDACGGVVVRSRGEGDSCFCVFAKATDAVRAALETQRALASESWSGPPIRVRIGIHTGTAEMRDGQYYGSVVNRCARLRGAGHGGQTLVSAASAEIVRDDLPGGATLEDLGTHRLPDLAQPERIYQLRHPSLPGVFPALATLDAFPNNLPLQLTRFVNRDKELDDIASLLHEARLVTIVGPGGCGKTRLAVQAAAAALDRFPDGVWLVPLSAISDPALVDSQVAATLGLREEAGRTLATTVTEHLGRRAVLLVLDNCEHLVSAAATAASAILTSCPNVRIVATSRQALGVAGEVARLLDPLSVPGDAGGSDRRSALGFDSVLLLQDRAASARPGFAVTDENASAVAHICRRLDGIPLAIELAAARVGSLGPQELARRLDDRFRLLSSARRGGPERHQTLEAAVDWSYELLGDDERLLFRRLAVFVGRFRLAAAEEVARGDSLARESVAELLASLVDRSLVFADTHGVETSYRMLATIRAFAIARLEESGEEGALRSRHLDWFVRLAEEAEPELVGADQARWLDVLAGAHDDIRAALAWGLEYEPDVALRLALALAQFWDARGHWTEGRRWLEAALRAAPEGTVAYGRAMSWAGNLAHEQGDEGAARGTLERALDLQRGLADDEGAVLTLTRVGSAAAAAGDRDAAQRYFDEGLAILRQGQPGPRAVGLLINLAMSAHARGDPAARSLWDEALALSRERGHARGIAAALIGLGNLAQTDGDLERARSTYREALELFRDLGDKRGVATTLSDLAVTARARGELEEASDLLAEALPLHREVGDRRATALALARLGTVAWARGDLELAGRRDMEALGAFRELGDVVGATLSLVSLARVARASGDEPTAAMWLRQALEGCARAPEVRPAATCLEELAGLLVARDPEGAAKLFGAATAIRDAAGATGRRTAQASYDADVAALRRSFGEDVTDKEWAAGRAMAPADAVAYAGRAARQL